MSDVEKITIYDDFGEPIRQYVASKPKPKTEPLKTTTTFHQLLEDVGDCLL